MMMAPFSSVPTYSDSEEDASTVLQQTQEYESDSDPTSDYRPGTPRENETSSSSEEEEEEPEGPMLEVSSEGEEDEDPEFVQFVHDHRAMALQVAILLRSVLRPALNETEDGESFEQAVAETLYYLCVDYRCSPRNVFWSQML
jgi:hypothetical protein